MERRILIVEDDPDISALARFALEELGHQIMTCENGREVFAALKSFNPELVLMDVALPGIDGHTLVTMMSQDEDFRKIPVIVLTAHEGARQLFTSFQQVNRFIPKPFEMDELMGAVSEALGRNLSG